VTPSEVGERAEAAILAALVAAGKRVLLPFGGQRRYDLAYEEYGRLVKVQCKSGRERNGAIIFRTHSDIRGERRDYREDIDLFGIYCHDRNEVYLVPVGDVPTSAAHLRLHPPRNGQHSKVRWAAQYLLVPDPDGDPGCRRAIPQTEPLPFRDIG
jgi:PD-(D/E)XK endonuclease